MSPAIFAVLAGLFFALSSIYTRWGLERASTGSAVLITALANVVIFWPLFLIFAPFESISSWAVLAFIKSRWPKGVRERQAAITHRAQKK